VYEYEIAAPFIIVMRQPCDLGTENPESACAYRIFTSLTFE
jgi:hypothetical protein